MSIICDLRRESRTEVSKYELDDDLVRRVISGRTTGTDQDALFLKLEAQVPLPTPTNVGAIVRTEDGFNGGLYLRWAHDNATTSPWVQVGNHEQPYRTDEIGRITEVLSEGVDL